MRRSEIDPQLRKVPLFRSLGDEQLRMVAALATHLELPAGIVLATQQGGGFEFILIVRGQVEVRRGDRLLATLGPGKYVGETALVEESWRTPTVVATTPVIIEVIRRREFRGLLDDFPEIADALDRIIT